MQVSIGGFQIPLEVVVLGTITGLIYALLAIGLILAYKSSRVINFAHGEMGAMAAGIIPPLVILHHWPYWLALALALVVAAGTGMFMELVIVRHFRKSPRLIVLVATIGASQLFFVVQTFYPKGRQLGQAQFPTPFHATLTIGSLRLLSGPILILIAVPLITAALAIFLRATKLGLGSRAAAENRDAALVAGIPIARVSLAVWTIIGVLAGVSAVLIGPTQPVVNQTALGPQLLVRALAAAMIAGLSSLPQAFIGGIAIGVLESVLQWNYPTGGSLEVVIFAVIIATLLFRKGLGTLARGGEASSWSLTGALRDLPPALARNVRVRTAKGIGLAGLIVGAVLIALPATSAQRVLMSSVALFAAMALSLVVLTGFAGQVSLGQFAFVALGAIVGGRFHQLGYPPWMCVIYATAAGGLAALIIGLPALRIRGLFLAVATLAFAVAGPAWFYHQTWLVKTNAQSSSLQIPRPTFAGIDFRSDLHYYWLSLGVLIVLAAAVHRLRNSGIGRAMMAVRDNETSAASMGVSPRRIKLLAFVIAGMIAAMAGYFYGGLLVSFNQPGVFAPELSLALVGLVILGGVTTITGAVLGALQIKGLTYIVGPLLPRLVGSSVTFIVGGVGLLAALYQFPAGIAEIAFKVRDWGARRLSGRPDDERVPATGEVAVTERPRLLPGAGVRVRERAGVIDVTDGTGQRVDDVGAGGEREPEYALEARDVVVRFGGNLAVNRVSLNAKPGEIVGLVGPNGAGKTTLFDVLSGQLKPQAGEVFLFDEEVTYLRPAERAQLGLGRTFQQARIFDDMRLVDAIKVALECDAPSEVVPSVLGLRPSRRAEKAKDLRAEEIVDLLGLRRYAGFHIAELSTGTRRLAELGCMIAVGARVLLLDEPAAGIAQREIEAFRPVLREVRDFLDATMVIVEHDIPMIMGLVDRLYVLTAGEVLAEGPPSIMRENKEVIAAYLGSDERVISRSGSLAAATAGMRSPDR
jgi:ABC-type branched-subunit amino acid transport system ATPase component/ABC-type branched-subunit amino acid transport system permease subunit